MRVLWLIWPTANCKLNRRLKAWRHRGHYRLQQIDNIGAISGGLLITGTMFSLSCHYYKFGGGLGLWIAAPESPAVHPLMRGKPAAAPSFTGSGVGGQRNRWLPCKTHRRTVQGGLLKEEKKTCLQQKYKGFLLKQDSSSKTMSFLFCFLFFLSLRKHVPLMTDRQASH